MYRILIVDDEPLMLEYLRKQLNDYFNDGNLRLFQAENGTDAVARLKESEIDIVITDIRMPELSGLELAKLLQQDYSDIFALLISGYDEFSYAHEAIKYGVTDYLLKPVVKSELVDALQKLCKRVDHRRDEKRLYSNLRSGNLQTATVALNSLSEKKDNRCNEISQSVTIGKKFIMAHYNEAISLSVIAQKAGVSESYFSTTFHKEVGESYIRFLTGIRMHEAARLLRESPNKVYEIAQAVGYVSVKHFNHTFKQWYGMTPIEYQQSNIAQQ